MDKRTRAPKGADTSPAVTRRKYSRPVLQVYGSVAQLTMSGLLSKGDGTQMMMALPSDRRLKQDIVRIGEHPLGFGLYLFRYRAPLDARFGAGRRLGVMADEVEAVLPDAVVVQADGYKRVDYARLGLATP